VIFGGTHSSFIHCLRCDALIDDYEFDMNNGVCNGCPPLTEVHPSIKEMLAKLEAKQQ
jgi:hypothetical protein